MHSLPSLTTSRRRPRAWLADADPCFRPYAAAALRQSGFDVQELRDTASLIASFAPNGTVPDIVVIHTGLACSSALDAVRRIRQLAPDLPILMVADATAVGALRDGLSTGASVVLPRPSKVVEIAASARQLVRARASRAEAASASSAS